jgi:uncharacterized protein (TIGR00159 family)
MDDIALSMAVSGVRFEPSIPGKSAVGIEVPNTTRETVFLRGLVESEAFQNEKSRLTSCLGADITGRPVVFDISKMPHLLVAGATGMGKSVCINSIILSLLYKAKPDEVKMILIDPKKVEFAIYRDMPHLQIPVISDPQKAAGALCSAVSDLSRDKVGALIVIEQTTKLGEYIKSGVSIDAALTPHLVRNIFFDKAPLHDGAVIIRSGRILAAGCFLPLSTNEEIDKDLGTRHRAAIGLTEVSDALVIVVSEETGNISVSMDGNLERNFGYSTLKQVLNTHVYPQASNDVRAKDKDVDSQNDSEK